MNFISATANQCDRRLHSLPGVYGGGVGFMQEDDWGGREGGREEEEEEEEDSPLSLAP